MKKGWIIALEGGEGAGKTTVMTSICQWFSDQNIDYLSTREPGGVNISEQIRNIILDKDHGQMDGRTEALLFAAARRQHLVEKVRPALKEGKVVIFDRYVDSSLVYQGHVRGMGIQEVFDLNAFAIEGLLPDITLYFDLSPQVGLGRIKASDEREVNRLDLETLDFHEKVRQGYLLLSQTNDRYEVINAEQDIEAVIRDVKEALVKKGILRHE